MNQTLLLLVFILLLVVPAADASRPGDEPEPAEQADHEVWVIDQSDTTPEGGGTLYVYPGPWLGGRDAARVPPEVIDLGGEVQELCLARTGSAPRRPHMLEFSAGHSHAILAFVATGHVLFIDAATRAPVACVDVGAQAHAAIPAPDDPYVMVANRNGKLLQRIRTDYAAGTFALDDAATLDLAACVTPGGAACQSSVMRPDNAPICPIVDRAGRFTFVTLRGGGMFAVDSRAAPLEIVAEYDRQTVRPNGCGGAQARGKMYVNAGGGTAGKPLEAELYAFDLAEFSEAPSPPNTPAPRLIFSHSDRGFVDSQGAVLTKGHCYLWVADRAANRIAVVDTRGE